MAKNNDPVSPEEKLLRVIQGETPNTPAGSEPAPTAEIPPVARPVASNPAEAGTDGAKPISVKRRSAPVLSKPKPNPAPTAVPVSGSAPKKVASATVAHPKLKTAAVSAGAGTGGAKPTSVKSRVAPKPVLPPPDSGASFAETGVARRKQGARRSGFGVASRLLALAALALLLLSAWEIRGAYRQADAPEPTPLGPGPDPDLQTIPARLPLPELDQTLSLWRQRPLLVQPNAPTPQGPKDPTPNPPKTDWEVYMRDNLKLLGLSRLDGADSALEALVSDAKTGRMHYVQVGSQILIETRKLDVVAIEKDRIVLTDGNKKIPLR